jgi:hypothetical protein
VGPTGISSSQESGRHEDQMGGTERGFKRPVQPHTTICSAWTSFEIEIYYLHEPVRVNKNGIVCSNRIHIVSKSITSICCHAYLIGIVFLYCRHVEPFPRK